MRMLEEEADEGEEVVVLGYELVTRRSQAEKCVTLITFVCNFSDPVGETKNPTKKHLPNGDFYTSFLVGNVPHSAGKYPWPDGCMYEGEWHKGKTAEKGKFSWPSGATFDGEFRSSFMDGFGTITGYNGDTYRGMWSMNQKHGFGQTPA